MNIMKKNKPTPEYSKAIAGKDNTKEMTPTPKQSITEEKIIKRIWRTY